MRDQLRELEGQLVYATGRLQRMVRVEGHTYDGMLTTVKFWRWNGEPLCKPPDREPDATADHAWIRGGAGPELLEAVFSLGRISYYRRADGSIDLGLKIVEYFDLEAAIMSTDKLPWEKRLAYLRKVSRRLKKSEREGKPVATLKRPLSFCRAWLNDEIWMMTDAVKKIAKYKERLATQEEERRSRRAKPRGLNALGPINQPHRNKGGIQSTTGFNK